jgi:hypothetical protein
MGRKTWTEQEEDILIIERQKGTPYIKVAELTGHSIKGCQTRFHEIWTCGLHIHKE